MLCITAATVLAGDGAEHSIKPVSRSSAAAEAAYHIAATPFKVHTHEQLLLEARLPVTSRRGVHSGLGGSCRCMHAPKDIVGRKEVCVCICLFEAIVTI